MKSIFYKEDLRIKRLRNPYAFKLAPGRETSLFFGTVIGQRNMFRLFEKFNTFKGSEREGFRMYIHLLEKLERGESIG